MRFAAPPRRVRLRAAAARWWPLGVTAGTALVVFTVTMLVMLAMDGFRLPFADWRLDSVGVVSERTAKVLGVRATSGHFGSQVVHEVDYSYDPGDGQVRPGTCYTLGRRYDPGAEVAVEYLAEDPSQMRLRHSARAESALWAPVLLPFWLAALVATGFWYSRVWRVRVLLRHGLAAEATLLAAVPLRWVNPPQLRVHYEFTTSAGTRHEGRQWLRQQGVSGQRIQGLAAGSPISRAAAIYDEAHPQRSRLLAEEDVEPEP